MFANLRFHRQRERLYTWLIAMVGIVLAIAAAWFARDYALRLADEGFRREVTARCAALDASLAQHLQMVRSLEAFAATRTTMNSADFHTFVTTMRADTSGIQAMQWMPRIAGGKRAEFERSGRADFPRFHIIEQIGPWELGAAATRDVYAPVRLIVPVAGNEASIGFDLYSDPLYADALDRAARTGDVAATERLVLLQEEAGVQYGVLLVSAVAGVGADGAPRGYVGGVFRIGDLLQSAIAGLPPVGLHISVADASGPGAERTLHVFSDRLTKVRDLIAVPFGQTEMSMGSELIASCDLPVADRTWRIYFEPGPGYFAPLPPIPDWAAAVLLLLMTGLLTSLFLLMQKRAQLLARASLSDGLTGLANRAFCDRMLNTEWERAIRNGRSLSVVMVDIDQFADYNAKLGSLAGDDCLRRIADALAVVPSRSSDLVCRYTGDRFAVILPETTEEGAGQLAARVIQTIKALALVHPGRAPEAVVTVSVVAATARPKRGDFLPAFMEKVTDPLDSSARQAGNVVIGLPVASS